MALRRTTWTSPPFVPVVHPIATGLAAGVVPVSQSIIDEPVQNAVIEAVRRSIPEHRRLDVAFLSVPCTIGGFVGVLVTGFAHSEEAGAYTGLVVFLIVAWLQWRDRT